MLRASRSLSFFSRITWCCKLIRSWVLFVKSFGVKQSSTRQILRNLRPLYTGFEPGTTSSAKQSSVKKSCFLITPSIPAEISKIVFLLNTCISWKIKYKTYISEIAVNVQYEEASEKNLEINNIELASKKIKYSLFLVFHLGSLHEDFVQFHCTLLIIWLDSIRQSFLFVLGTGLYSWQGRLLVWNGWKFIWNASITRYY